MLHSDHRTQCTCIENIQNIHPAYPFSITTWKERSSASMQSKEGVMGNSNLVVFRTSCDPAELSPAASTQLCTCKRAAMNFELMWSNCSFIKFRNLQHQKECVFSYVLFWGTFSSPNAAHNKTTPMQGTDMAFPAIRTWDVRHALLSWSMGVQLSSACCLVTGRTWEDSASRGSRKRPWA